MSFSQQVIRVYRVGILSLETASGFARRGAMEAVRSGLGDLGYIEGRNLVIETRFADGQYELLPELVADLVRLKVDVIITHGTPGTRAASQASRPIPVVSAMSGDPVGTGLVGSIARPGANITGSTFFNPEIMAKRLEWLKTALPTTKQTAVLVNSHNPSFGPIVQAMTSTARALKVALLEYKISTSGELGGAFAAMAQQRVESVVIDQDGMFNSNGQTIVGLAAKYRLLSAGGLDFALEGGLIGYGPDSSALFRRSAYFVDKILKGTKPGDMPVEQASRFELIINKKTANAIGHEIPRELLLHADRTIG